MWTIIFPMLVLGMVPTVIDLRRFRISFSSEHWFAKSAISFLLLLLIWIVTLVYLESNSYLLNPVREWPLPIAIFVIVMGIVWFFDTKYWPRATSTVAVLMLMLVFVTRGMPKYPTFHDRELVELANTWFELDEEFQNKWHFVPKIMRTSKFEGWGVKPDIYMQGDGTRNFEIDCNEDSHKFSFKYSSPTDFNSGDTVVLYDIDVDYRDDVHSELKLKKSAGPLLNVSKEYLQKNINWLISHSNYVGMCIEIEKEGMVELKHNFRYYIYYSALLEGRSLNWGLNVPLPLGDAEFLFHYPNISIMKILTSSGQFDVSDETLEKRRLESGYKSYLDCDVTIETEESLLKRLYPLSNAIKKANQELGPIVAALKKEVEERMPELEARRKLAMEEKNRQQQKEKAEDIAWIVKGIRQKMGFYLLQEQGN